MRHFTNAFRLAAVCALICSAAACHRLDAGSQEPALRMAGIFGNDMVLQRGLPLPVWGWAAPGREIHVEAGPHAVRARANHEGRWRVTLPPLNSGDGALTMTVSDGLDAIELGGILVGEVWLCSGQSNMQMSVADSANAKVEIASADHPQIRLFSVPRTTAIDPHEEVNAQWQICSPSTIPSFSAVGYYFGREIQDRVEVPVGLINASWGGTIIETWTRFEEVSRLPGMMERIAAVQDLFCDESPPPKAVTVEETKALRMFQTVTDAEADEKLARRMTHPGWRLRRWETMEIPNQWEKAGLPDFNGMVWFHKVVEVPSSWAGKDLVLRLGPVDEVDVTWFNGKRVGGMGSLKSGDLGKWNAPRVYSIPGRLVKAGGNAITVRAIDTNGAGGLWGAEARDMALCLKDGRESDRVGIAGVWRFKAGPELVATPSTSGPGPNHPTLLYNAMINPIAPFAIRGAIWYQGESNNGDGMLYRDKMEALVQCWRNVFLRPEAPFYFVQIAPFRYSGGREKALPFLWEAQTAVLDIPHTGMAVISDVGNVADIHPKNKQVVGKRLAAWALAMDYGQEDEVYSGPLYKSMIVRGDEIQIDFDHAGSGLTSRDDKPLTWFEIAGEDGRFVKATAVIDGDSVRVSSPEVPGPVAVRFAWDQEAEPNLTNREGLPAVPFRTQRR